MDNRYFIEDIRLIANESSSEALKKVTRDEGGLEISGGNATISYWESISDPDIKVQLANIVDVDQFVSRYGITGGELLTLRVKFTKEGDEENKDFEITKDHKLVLNAITDVITTSRAQRATLQFVSQESLIDETARLSKRFTGNISNIVNEILITDKKGIQTKKKFEAKDSSFNIYTFVGNMKRPFDTIQWLAPKAATDKEDCGFLFFENYDGYNFRSIKKMIESKPVKKYTRVDSTPYGEDSLNITNAKINQTGDLIKNLRIGTYANKTIYINLETARKTIFDYKISDNTGIKNPPKLPEKLDEHPSRLMLRLIDPGAMQKGSKKSEEELEADLAKYQNKSYSRVNLLNSYSMNIEVAFSADLRVGDTIELRFPYKADEKTVKKGKSDFTDLSGIYLIKNLRHEIGNSKSATFLEIIRDTFSAK